MITGIEEVIVLIFHHLNKIICIRNINVSVFHRQIADHPFMFHIKEISSSPISTLAVQLEDIIFYVRL